MAQLRPHLHILLSALVTFTKWKNDWSLRWMSLRARELGLRVGHASFLFHLPDTAVLWILKALPSHWGWSPYFGTQLGPPKEV